MISIRKKEAGEDSRPSSSEWIERKITVKKPLKGATKRTISNRLITKVKSISKAVNSTSESEYSDTPSADDSPRRKRKPNLSWVQKEPKEGLVFSLIFHKNLKETSDQVSEIGWEEQAKI